VLDRCADKYGIRPKGVNELIWGYADDMISDLFYETEEVLRREIDEEIEREGQRQSGKQRRTCVNGLGKPQNKLPLSYHAWSRAVRRVRAAIRSRSHRTPAASGSASQRRPSIRCSPFAVPSR
jgi:hypothetical protein